MANAEKVVRRYFGLTSEGRLDDAVVLIHPEAVLLPPWDGLLRGRGQYERQAKVEMHEGSLHEATATSFIPVDDERIVVVGRLRWSDGEGGFSDKGVVWAIRIKDDLIWRLRDAPTKEEALSAAQTDDWPD